MHQYGQDEVRAPGKVGGRSLFVSGTSQGSREISGIAIWVGGAGESSVLAA